ncbi:C10 family peptidase [Flavobacterium sp. UW10123]|uniref:C10 family peptidase n=1 Tax=Flavobacterium sp. UW10123 TaxID=3230800 RepID=UPI00339874A7
MKKSKPNPNHTKFNLYGLTKILFLVITLLFLASCSNEKEDGELNPSSNSTNKVSKETIILIAQNFFKNTSITGKNVIQNRTIKSTKEYVTSKKESAFYVINYNEGGFIILAADNRVSPILAYSDSGNFATTDQQIIPPVAYWMEGQKKEIQAKISNNQVQTKEIKSEWNAITNKSTAQIKTTSKTSYVEPEDPTSCPDYSTYVKGPLLTTNWGQGDGYNNLLALNCSHDYYFGYKAATGCVATSMAQIMRYFQKPNTYNWNNMPNNGQYGYGTYDIQLLMKNAGASVNMSYGCGLSSAVTANAATALKNTFGYHYATFGNFNLNTVIQNLNNNRPVILTGGTNSGGSYVNGHAWVCDGYSQTTIYHKDDYGVCLGASTYQAILHMNWGWDGDYNGYYSVGSFNPGTYTFNYQNGMLYDIGL